MCVCVYVQKAPKTGETAVILAAAGGYTDCIQHLLNAKRDLKATDTEGRTAVIRAGQI